MYVVCVTFQIAQGAMGRFMPLMYANATTSLHIEPQCHQFDVSHDGHEVFLYELYADRAAFDTHLASAHFKEFDAAVAPMITDKRIKTFDAHWAPVKA